MITKTSAAAREIMERCLRDPCRKTTLEVFPSSEWRYAITRLIERGRISVVGSEVRPVNGRPHSVFQTVCLERA